MREAIKTNNINEPEIDVRTCKVINACGDKLEA